MLHPLPERRGYRRSVTGAGRRHARRHDAVPASAASVTIAIETAPVSLWSCRFPIARAPPGEGVRRSSARSRPVPHLPEGSRETLSDVSFALPRTIACATIRKGATMALILIDPTHGFLAAPVRRFDHKLLISFAISRVDLVRLQTGCCHRPPSRASAKTPVRPVDNVDIVHGGKRSVAVGTASSNPRFPAWTCNPFARRAFRYRIEP